MALPSEYDSKFWLAILHELDAAGGSNSPSNIYPRMRQYFPGITDEDTQILTTTGENKWTNMIQWARQHLVYRDCIDNSVRGKWVLADAGRQWLLANWKGPTADYSEVKKPALIKAANPPKLHARNGSDSGNKRRGGAVPAPILPALAGPQTIPPSIPSTQNVPPVTAPTPLVVVDPVEQLCQRIRASQRLSNAPQQFEQALSDAFTFLGYKSTHIGGPSEPDIFVEAALGQSAYTIVVDAKSTHLGRVPDAQISWPVIDSYRKKRSATFAAVIGEDFSGGQLQTFASQYTVVLITTGMLCDLIRLHAEAPFNLNDLRDLFAVIGRADAGVQALKERFSRNRQHWQLIIEIVDTIERFQQSTPGGSAPKIDNLHFYLMLMNSHAPTAAPTLQDVTDAVAFLSSRAVNILVEVPGSNGAYQLAMGITTARKRVLALARFFDALASVSAAAVATTKTGP